MNNGVQTVPEVFSYRLDQTEKKLDKIDATLDRIETKLAGKFESTDEKLAKLDREIDRIKTKAGVISFCTGTVFMLAQFIYGIWKR